MRTASFSFVGWLSLLLALSMSVSLPRLIAGKHAGCQPKLDEDRVRERQILAIKQQILDKLGLRNAPRELPPTNISREAMDLYRTAVARRRKRKRRNVREEVGKEVEDEGYFAKRLVDIPITLNYGESHARAVCVCMHIR